MPPSLRVQVSRGTASSSRPYDRHSPTASPAKANLAHFHLSQTLPPALPVQEPSAELEQGEIIPPDHPNLPTYANYKRIETEYLHSLSPRKRDKALITQAMFDKIWDVLHQPEACTIETPQFRFWVRKMFTLSRPTCVGGWDVGATTSGYPEAADSDDERAGLELERAMGIDGDGALPSAVVLHENRPVAIMEQLYELFCYCHVRAGHGGRDKTCAVIRQHYSWVPKELTAQFVKACPTCALKRSGQGGLGMDMGVVVPRQVGQRRLYGAPVVEVVSEPLVAPSLGNTGWPTTGGPLDPRNHQPCGVRGREWSRAHESAGTLGRWGLGVSPARASLEASTSGSRVRSISCQVPPEGCLPTGWGGAHQTDASAEWRSDETSHCKRTRRTRSLTEQAVPSKSPTRAGLPSLTTALSNESLDQNVNLTGLEPVDTAGESLPPMLRPLRLRGPVPSDPESDVPPASLPPPSESYLFQIDPVLLSFDYPGVENASGSNTVGGTALCGGTLVSSEARLASLQGPGHRGCPIASLDAGAGVYRLPRCAPSGSGCIDVERLNASPGRFAFEAGHGMDGEGCTARSLRCSGPSPLYPCFTDLDARGQWLDGPGSGTFSVSPMNA